jgi:hypothetical protein
MAAQDCWAAVLQDYSVISVEALVGEKVFVEALECFAAKQELAAAGGATEHY